MSGLAVDFRGNPAFIDVNGRINWKKNGAWIVIDDCARDIAFGGKGYLYMISCELDGNHVYKYKKHKWIAFPNQTQKALSLTVAPSGTPWIITWDYEVLRFRHKKWTNMGLPNARDLTAGPRDVIYGLAKD